MASQWSPSTFMVGPGYLSNLPWACTSPRLRPPSCCSSDIPRSARPGPWRYLPVWHASPRFACNSQPHDSGLGFSVTSLFYPNPSPCSHHSLSLYYAFRFSQHFPLCETDSHSIYLFVTCLSPTNIKETILFRS